jgi:hypothetical protein
LTSGIRRSASGFRRQTSDLGQKQVPPSRSASRRNDKANKNTKRRK